MQSDLQLPVPAAPLTGDRLRQRLTEELAAIDRLRLPGWETFLSSDPKIKGWMDDLAVRVANAIRDEDEVRFNKEISSTIKAWERVNELVAEAYRKEHTDQETWELRYVKWMKIAFIKFASTMGDFYVVPRPPARKPSARHWYTVDEMMVLLRPEIAEIIVLSGKLPERGEFLKPAAPDEKIFHIDATGQTVKSHYEFHKPRRPRYG